ncbi:MAG: hypothetical protein L3I99_01980 [Sulfurimonas sp.]|nr:hypothetical protein [Sulfurimonas sp.]
MLTLIKSYANIAIGAVVIAFLAYVKYLRYSNAEQKENISRLKKEIVVQKLVSNDEVKREIFKTKQKTIASLLKNNEITIDAIEREIKYNETNNNDSNSFSSIRM